MKEKHIKSLVAIMRALFVLVAIVGFGLLIGFGVENQKATICSDLNVDIDHRSGLFFMDDQDVKAVFRSVGYDTVQGRQLKDLNLDQIEAKLRKHPFVDEVAVFANIKGAVYVQIAQKQPLLRVMHKSGVDYYIDNQGSKMPVCSKFTARVPVVTGITTAFADTTDLDSLRTLELYRLAQFIDASSFWTAQVEQININSDGEYELVPRLGDHIILLGTLDNMELKFRNLRIFYEEGLKKTGWTSYKKINLKYNNQIVCTKK